LKDLWQQWRGVLLSYDEGIIKGDAVLAGAVWRNVFKGDEETDIQDLALVTAYLRGQLKILDQLSDADIGEGRVEFQGLNKFKAMVAQPAPMMRKEFSNAEVGASKAIAE
jgi:cytochrome b pre-mRNA-processing protein 3